MEKIWITAYRVLRQKQIVIMQIESTKVGNIFANQRRPLKHVLLNY